MSASERAKVVYDFLKAEGYAPQLDDETVVFKAEGKAYIITLEDDALFYRIVFPNFWPIDSDQEQALVTLAAEKATSGVKVAKVFPVDKNMWATVELFSQSPQQFCAVFNRSMSALRAAVTKFTEAMRELARS